MGLIAIYQDLFASIGEIFILVGGMGTWLSFFGYYLIKFRHFPKIS